LSESVGKARASFRGLKEDRRQPLEEIISRLLNQARVIAVVGLSPKEDRPSHQVARYLQDKGYKIIPVNPQVAEVLGEKCYPNLGSIPGKVDIVDIFRRPELVPEIVEEAIRIGARAVWMQEGIVNEPAAERARKAGLEVIMDRCMKKELERLSP